jgi:hypothetical protein
VWWHCTVDSYLSSPQTLTILFLNMKLLNRYVAVLCIILDHKVQENWGNWPWKGNKFLYWNLLRWTTVSVFSLKEVLCRLSLFTNWVDLG